MQAISLPILLVVAFAAVAANAAARFWLEKLHGPPPQPSQLDVMPMQRKKYGVASLILLLGLLAGPLWCSILIAIGVAAKLCFDEGRRFLFLGARRSPPAIQFGILGLWLIQAAGFTFAFVQCAQLFHAWLGA